MQTNPPNNPPERINVRQLSLDHYSYSERNIYNAHSATCYMYSQSKYRVHNERFQEIPTTKVPISLQKHSDIRPTRSVFIRILCEEETRPPVLSSVKMLF
ncbi:hypothetical protein LOAG_06160 [Loa loa]|uniref:Uncharacterized protein n=1 Tax=Loa loa TaxID=7209 RepID=A0A1S0U095_LOALO|nr:hypothetical protein LOAG_06160 [Loa loa]EFO22330.1 hypothetical protein LOAG_06160 [Loa loa]